MKMIFHLTYRGFYSEILNMNHAFLYALNHGYEFNLYSKGWVSGYDKGWQDYFIPFCNEVTEDKFRHHTILPRERFNHWRLNLIDRKWRILSKKITNTPLFAQDLFYEFRDPKFLRKRFSLPQYHASGNIFQAQSALLKSIFRFNEATRVFITEQVRNIGLPDTYAALHIRRGDKTYGALKEAAAVEVSEYVHLAQEKLPNISSYFVATDDFSIIEEIQRNYPYLTIFSLCQPHQRGHIERSFKALSPESRKHATLQFLVESQVMRNATVFVGTFSSNVGRAMNLLRNGKTYSVDTDWAPI